MSDNYYSSENVLKEGDIHKFNLIKQVKLEDNNDYFVLEDQFGIRHFIESWHYGNYNLEIGAEVFCLIAKVNCTGRIYLEPFHPYYKIGEVYSFNKVELVESSTTSLTVTDIFGNEITINATSDQINVAAATDIVEAIVIGLKKGIPELEIFKIFDIPGKQYH